MKGKTLGERYEILEEIGSGGMAVVYKARDTMLKRNVAVKVLREEYAKDEEFIKRFKTESEAAANLSHPNIVSIYDVGEEDEVNYIVMELVEGETLKDYIKEKTMLSWQEAVKFTKQICAALECAHKSGTIHRDIKPHNIMVTEDQILKVMDFGIARAASSTTMTMSGSTIGSVHYFSPEQARGGYVDEKSDIYSAGIVMYEMLSGKVPFDGESPIAVAIKQIQQEPDSPRDVNMSIPLAVAAVAVKAIAKNPMERYQNATEMLESLEKAKDPRAEKKAVVAAKDEATKKVEAVAVPVDKGISDEGKKSNNKLKIFTIAAVVALVVMLTLGMAFLLMPGLITPRAQEAVPDVVGRNIDEVMAELQGTNFSIEIQRRESSNEVAIDGIIEQTPVAGKMVGIPGKIKVVVSSGEVVNLLDDFAGKDERAATKAIEDFGAKVVVVQEVNDTVTEGYVIKTTPNPGATIKPGDEVTLYVSKGGGREITMPTLEGLSLENAKGLLAQYNLVLGEVKEEETDSVSVGQVISQSIEKDSKAKEYMTVNLVVAKAVTAPSPSPSPSTTPSVPPTSTPVPTPTPTVSPTANTKEIKITLQVSQKDMSKINISVEGGENRGAQFTPGGDLELRVRGEIGSTVKIVVNEGNGAPSYHRDIVIQ